MSAVLLLLAGLACAGAGGELFVRGTVALARRARVRPALIAATVAAFATSAPELAVSLSAAAAGRPQLGLGDALGSNVVNIALLLGLVAAAAGLRSEPGILKRDLPFALLGPVLTGLLLADGLIDRLDAGVLLAVFATWLALTVREARRQRRGGRHEPSVAGDARHPLPATVAGLVLLLASGQLLVAGGVQIATLLGLDVFVVGATIVAFGTSAPELATVLVARLRGHDEVGLGTLLGSNIFNGLLIVAAAALVHPIAMPWGEVAIALAAGGVAVLLTSPTRDRIGRPRGVMLLSLYGLYLFATLHYRT